MNWRKSRKGGRSHDDAGRLTRPRDRIGSVIGHRDIGGGIILDIRSSASRDDKRGRIGNREGVIDLEDVRAAIDRELDRGSLAGGREEERTGSDFGGAVVVIHIEGLGNDGPHMERTGEGGSIEGFRVNAIIAGVINEKRGRGSERELIAFDAVGFRPAIEGEDPFAGDFDIVLGLDDGSFAAGPGVGEGVGRAFIGFHDHLGIAGSVIDRGGARRRNRNAIQIKFHRLIVGGIGIGENIDIAF